MDEIQFDFVILLLLYLQLPKGYQATAIISCQLIDQRYDLTLTAKS